MRKPAAGDSPFMRAYRERVEALLGPIRRLYGEGTPVERTALVLLAEAADLEEELQRERVSTHEAAERTGWSYDTLQRRAKAVLEGKEVPSYWSQLQVEIAGGSYQFVLGSIPVKGRGDAHG